MYLGSMSDGLGTGMNMKVFTNKNVIPLLSTKAHCILRAIWQVWGFFVLIYV